MRIIPLQFLKTKRLIKNNNLSCAYCSSHTEWFTNKERRKTNQDTIYQERLPMNSVGS